MKIVNGRWQDQEGQPIDNFNVTSLIELGENVTKIYGEEISYSRIELVSAIKSLSPKQEQELAHVLSREGIMSKLAGY